MRRLAQAEQVPEELQTELALGMIQAHLQLQEQILHWLQHGVTTPIDTAVQPEPAPAPPPSAMKQPIASGPALSEFLPNFIDLMQSTDGWTGQTLAQNRASYRMFIEICGDRPVQSYTRRDTAAFYDVVRKLPKLYSKARAWRALSLAEIVNSTEGAEVERIQMKTLKRHFSALGRLFAHLKERGEYDGENPAHGFEFPGTKGKANQKRDMWQGVKLTRLFSSPVWTGCKSASRRSLPGKLIIKDEKYWLPLLGLYHGNRLEEFAQLRREDIKEEDGLWFFDINDEGDKQLKNEQSKRQVPLHPEVRALGFLDYVREVAPSDGDLVFPGLRPSGPDNKLGYLFTKWWSRYRRGIGLYEKGLDYHSFRHGVSTKLYAAHVPDAYVDVLTGHEGQGIGRKVYLKGLPLNELYAAICKVEWPEVELKGDEND